MRISLGIAILLLIDLLLAGALYRSWTATPEAPDVAGAPVAATLPAAQTGLARRLPGLADLTEVVERPLFSETRRPLSVAPAAEDDVSAAGLEEATLIGIYNRGDGRRALLRVAPQGPTRTIAAGDEVEDWTVAKIGAERVVLHRGADTLELELKPAQRPERERPEQAREVVPLQIMRPETLVSPRRKAGSYEPEPPGEGNNW